MNKTSKTFSYQIKDLNEIGDEQNVEAIIMGDKCSVCGDPSVDNCLKCRKPTCRRHGKQVGDYYVCRNCASAY